jgi:hypothetical protein
MERLRGLVDVRPATRPSALAERVRHGADTPFLTVRVACTSRQLAAIVAPVIQQDDGQHALLATGKQQQQQHAAPQLPVLHGPPRTQTHFDIWRTRARA